MDTIEKLLAEIKAMPGPLSRQRIINRRKEIEAARQAKRQSVIETGWGEGASAAPVAQPHDEEKSETAGGEFPSPQQGSAISGLLITPSHAHSTRLRKDYVQDGEPMCLRIGKQITETTVLLIVAPMNELQFIAGKLPYWNNRKFGKLFLWAKPEGPEVTLATAIAACGASDAITEALGAWPTETDPVVFCREWLNQLPGRRVHLFAESNTAGWESVVGDGNWSTEVSDA